MIRIENLNKEFQLKKDRLTVLKNIDLTINEGDIFGIIGMSGAGKSTLIRCINMLEEPTSGSIYIKSDDITKKNGYELRRQRKDIGMIFQNFNLLMQRNVRRNIAFGLEITKFEDFKVEGMSKEEFLSYGYFKKRKIKKEQIDKRVDELLELVDLKDKELVYPSRLSGGQRQRVAIARALATKPSILLCDEATSALDSVTTESILKLLKKINEERKVTIIVITHEMNVVERICNRVAVIDKSEIIASGNTKDIFMDRSSEVIKRLLGGDDSE